MIYLTMIIETNYIYPYIALAISNTVSVLLVQKYHREHSKLRKFFSFISYTVTLFVLIFAIFLFFINKKEVYFNFFTLFIGNK